MNRQSQLANSNTSHRESDRSDVHTQGVKGLMILNGGGSLALLTALTHIVTTSSAEDGFAPPPVAGWLTTALGLVVLDLVSGAWINHFRYEASRLHDSGDKENGRRFGFAHRFLFTFALLCFALGSTIVLIGLWWAIGLSSAVELILCVVTIWTLLCAILVVVGGGLLLKLESGARRRTK